jgi:hypothetical protein
MTTGSGGPNPDDNSKPANEVTTGFLLPATAPETDRKRTASARLGHVGEFLLTQRHGTLLFTATTPRNVCARTCYLRQAQFPRNQSLRFPMEQIPWHLPRRSQRVHCRLRLPYPRCRHLRITCQRNPSKQVCVGASPVLARRANAPVADPDRACEAAEPHELS